MVRGVDGVHRLPVETQLRQHAQRIVLNDHVALAQQAMQRGAPELGPGIEGAAELAASMRAEEVLAVPGPAPWVVIGGNQDSGPSSGLISRGGRGINPRVAVGNTNGLSTLMTCAPRSPQVHGAGGSRPDHCQVQDAYALERQSSRRLRGRSVRCPIVAAGGFGGRRFGDAGPNVGIVFAQQRRRARSGHVRTPQDRLGVPHVPETARRAG